jgi:hypothetical protein
MKGREVPSGTEGVYQNFLRPFVLARELGRPSGVCVTPILSPLRG